MRCQSTHKGKLQLSAATPQFDSCCLVFLKSDTPIDGDPKGKTGWAYFMATNILLLLISIQKKIICLYGLSLEHVDILSAKRIEKIGNKIICRERGNQ